MSPRETQPGPQAPLTELLFSIRDPGLPAALVALASHVCLIQFSTCSTVLKEMNPEYSLERLLLKLKLQYFGRLMRRDDPLEKILMPERQEEKGGQLRERWLGSITTQWT